MDWEQHVIALEPELVLFESGVFRIIDWLATCRDAGSGSRFRSDAGAGTYFESNNIKSSNEALFLASNIISFLIHNFVVLPLLLINFKLCFNVNFFPDPVRSYKRDPDPSRTCFRLQCLCGRFIVLIYYLGQCC